MKFWNTSEFSDFATLAKKKNRCLVSSGPQTNSHVVAVEGRQHPLLKLYLFWGKNSGQTQSSTKRRPPGLVNSVPAVAYHLCLASPAAFTQPGDPLLAGPCILYHFVLSPGLVACAESRERRERRQLT